MIDTMISDAGSVRDILLVWTESEIRACEALLQGHQARQVQGCILHVP